MGERVRDDDPEAVDVSEGRLRASERPGRLYGLRPSETDEAQELLSLLERLQEQSASPDAYLAAAWEVIFGVLRVEPSGIARSRRRVVLAALVMARALRDAGLVTGHDDEDDPLVGLYGYEDLMPEYVSGNLLPWAVDTLRREGESLGAEGDALDLEDRRHMSVHVLRLSEEGARVHQAALHQRATPYMWM